MNKKLEIKLRQLEGSRLQLLNELSKIPITKLNTSPAQGKWSVAQVIYHLNKAESLSLVYIGKKMHDVNNLKKTGFIEWLKLLIVKIAFWSPLKFKAPVNVLGDMPENVDYTDIVAQWNLTRNNLQQFLEKMPEELLSKNVFKQPAAGRLNIYQMVDFMQVHFNRHCKQINALTKS